MSTEMSDTDKFIVAMDLFQNILIAGLIIWVTFIHIRTK